MKKAISIYNIVVGISIIGLWLMLFFTDQIPELETEPYGIGFHIAIETIMAIVFIVSGLALLKEWKYSKYLFVFSTGMLVYSAINSSGYYADAGNLAMVLMFSILVLISGYFTIYVLRHE